MTTQRYEHPHRSRSSGYTLVELLVVLSILSAVSLIAMPVLFKAGGGTKARAQASEVAGLLVSARQNALLNSRETIVDFHTITGDIVVGDLNQTMVLSEDSEMRIIVPSSQALSVGVARISFFPEGGASGGIVRLISGATEYQISVDWLTGRVQVGE